MRECMDLPQEKGKKRQAVFTKGELTDLSDADFKFLKGQEGGPFNFYVNDGTFLVQASDEPEDDAPKSKLELEIEKLQVEKAKVEEKDKVFHHKKQERLNKLLAELEDAKTRQGK